MPCPKDRCAQPSEPLSLNLTNQPLDSTNEPGVAQSRVPFSILVGSRAPTEQRLPPRANLGYAPNPQSLPPASPFTEREHIIIIAGVVVSIQAQLFTSSTVAMTSVPCALLSFGIIFELLGALLAIAFLRTHSDNSLSSGSSLSRNRVTMWLPAVLILTGIAGLAVVLIMETFKV